MTSADPGQPGSGELLLRDLLAGAAGDDPYPAYARLREQAPVLVTRSGAVILSRFADIWETLRNPGLGKPEQGYAALIGRAPGSEVQAAMHRWQHTILFANPPEHTRLRRLISDQFTPRHIGRLQDQVAATTDCYLDRLDGHAEPDFISTVAQPLPARVIADLLGIPGTDWQELAGTVRDLVTLFEPAAPPDAAARAITAGDQLSGFLAPVLAAKRRHPADDLLSRLATARDTDSLDDTEMTATAILLFAAGFETTVNLLGNGLHALLTHPGQLARLRQQPGLIPGAVEEFLRFDSPVQMTSRAALRPCQAAGLQLTPGQPVVVLLGAGNRDPARFTRPDQLDVTRDEGTALSFATGAHFCLGAHLARMEAAEVFTRLLARYRHIDLASPPRHRPGTSLRGLAELRITTRR
ncbi:MAG: cytochrome P450 [Actinomycetota bacterium]|nr:cytochrome P450 [Actinomycetota bacterium]